MNFHLDPKNYATFVDATGATYVEKPSDYMTSDVLKQSAITQSVTAEGLSQTEFTKWVSADR